MSKVLKSTFYSLQNQNKSQINADDNHKIRRIIFVISQYAVGTLQNCPDNVILKSTHNMFTEIYPKIENEPCHEKTNILHMRKQRRRSASR